MSLKIGIVGLPNVGKSTLFNALTRTKAAEAQNYPFCTIDPNIGIVEVPDKRLIELSKVIGSEKVIPAAIEFVDIAGLVKGASQGEGLGNKFLANIRECNAIGHVIRGFDDSNIIHVHGGVDPKFDKEVIESELLLADMQTVENRLGKAKSESKSGDKEKKAYADLLEEVYQKLQEGVLASNLDLTDEQKLALRDLHLLTMKPHIYIVNVHEDEIGKVDTEKLAEQLGTTKEKVIPICAKVEEDLSSFTEEEAKDYLNELGLEETGLNSLIRSAYGTLGLITYFTSGPKESRAWTIRKGDSAPKAAGVIHTDFEKGFIKAEVVNWDHLVNSGSHAEAQKKGQLRLEGKDYIVQDGDVMVFKFSS
ncbi:redox-regulated ATPase YchF [Candidatus Peregrinibacteria bacterium CG10_big_fil_rev_8_21_14_0_10_36_19]|nr:MAG: redox-regulated ATPase YchF [Candidatus Peregrinibacteria bacterium CG10_big_fil_rev_8_21_14_0_10_36_19]